MKGRRCLVPADGFYEWKAGEGAKAPKVPHYLHRKDDRTFAMAFAKAGGLLLAGTDPTGYGGVVAGFSNPLVG